MELSHQITNSGIERKVKVGLLIRTRSVAEAGFSKGCSECDLILNLNIIFIR